MTAQIELFEQHHIAKRTKKTGAKIVTMVDGERMSQQCARILDLLRKKPQLNSTLVTVALKYTSRISDLRLLGYKIKCERVGNDGLTKYYLVGEPKRGDA
jgi:hypothetical protein